jgi:hypothetical protein
VRVQALARALVPDAAGHRPPNVVSDLVITMVEALDPLLDLEVMHSGQENESVAGGAPHAAAASQLCSLSQRIVGVHASVVWRACATSSH